jgi:hypothetical protein
MATTATTRVHQETARLWTIGVLLCALWRGGLVSSETWGALFLSC